MRNSGEVTKLVLMEIALGLKNLDSKSLEKDIKAAYSLSESEQKQAVEAKAFIQKASDIQADFDKQREELNGLEKAKNDANSAIAALKSEQEVTAKKKADLDDKSKSLLEQDSNIKEQIAHLKRLEKTLSNREKELVAREAKVAKDEEGLKQRALSISRLAAV